LILLLSELSEIITPTHKVNICRDKNDNKFIELALSANVKFIVSGDEDLLAVKKYKKIKILSAQEFLKILEK
jgi:putative PIN family toxin of toxin-antitoxin system